MSQNFSKIFIAIVAPLALSLTLSPSTVLAATIASGTATYEWNITGIDIGNSLLPYTQAAQGYYYYPPNNTLRDRFDFPPVVFDGVAGRAYSSTSLLSSATASISAISPVGVGNSFLTSGSVTMQTSATSVKEVANTADRDYSLIYLNGGAIRPTLDASTTAQNWTISTTFSDTSPGWSSSDPLVDGGYGYSYIYASFWMGTGWRDKDGVLWNVTSYTSSGDPVSWNWDINPNSPAFYFSQASSLLAYYEDPNPDIFSWVNVPNYTSADFFNAERPSGFIADYTYSVLTLSLASSAHEWGDAGQTPLPNPAPEPATLSLLGIALAGLAGTRRRKQ